MATNLVQKSKVVREREVEAARADYRPAADKLSMMADATRAAIFVLLDGGPRDVMTLCRELGVSTQPAISHHLSILRHSGMVTFRRYGARNMYFLTDDGQDLLNAVRPLFTP